MRVAFAGTPSFAATALEAIVASGHIVSLVLTQPDRPAGRGMKLNDSAVARAAERLSLPTQKPASLREPQAQQALRDADIDVLVVAAYGLLLPPAVLATPRRGCINIHASLLPRWRGAAPIQHAILAGDSRTGISIMQMDAGLDTGPVLLAESIAIGATDTAGRLTESLAHLGARLIVAALASIDSLRAEPQDAAAATHAPKVSRAEASIDWSQPADAIERRVRALNPSPGAETGFGAETLKIWESSLAALSGAPGEILACDGRGIVVACGSGALALQRVQRAGGKPLPGSDFARGARLLPGAFFETRKRDIPAVSHNPLK